MRRLPLMMIVMAPAVGALVAGPAAARVASVRLTFERDPGAELCPAPQEVRKAVVRRLEVDPFTDDGVMDIHVTVSGDMTGLHARIAIIDDPKRVPAERLLSSARLDCRDLANAIELALSIAINPRLALGSSVEPQVSVATDRTAPVPDSRPPPTAESQRPPSLVPTDASGPALRPAMPPSVASAPPRTTPSPQASPPAIVTKTHEVGGSAPRARPSRQISLGVDALAVAGLGPGPALGAGVDVGVRRRRWSLELDARVVMPSSADVAGGTVTAWLGTLALAPCGHFSTFAACVVGGVGALRGRGEGFVLTNSTTLPIFSVGARVAWERPLGERWWLRLSAELNAVVGRAHLLVDGSEAWASPRVNALLVASGGSRFP